MENNNDDRIVITKIVSVGVCLILVIFLVFWGMRTLIPPPENINNINLESGYSFVKWVVGILLYFCSLLLGLEFEIPIISNLLNKKK